MKRALVVSFAAVLWCGRADACHERNAVSVRVPTFFAHGAAVAYERFLPSEASVGFGLAYRSTAGGDYASNTVVATAEARYWLIGEGPFSCGGHYEMTGPYVGARLDVGATTERDRLEERTIGTAWTVMPSTWLGWRVRFGRVEVTPAAATIVRTELGGHLARYTTVTVAYDLTVGWLF